MRRAALVALLLAAVVVGNLTLPSWHRALYRPVPYSSPVDILLDVLGEIRTFMARMLWFKMDVYHHAMELQGIPWTRERELLPFYKLTLLLDPRFEDVYDLASYD
ncbi:MAG TPA: hypothetical protein VNO81_02890, partial [Candidatus Nitrosotenuis sp.]|nr:hypothetical protein [Candidatus Nitrosotenuis sp.]